MKYLKWIAVLSIFVIGVVLIITNIVESQYTTAGEEEEQIETSKESVSLEEDKPSDDFEDKDDEEIDDENTEKDQQAEIIKYTLDNLNMRSGPGVSHEVLLTIPMGEKVVVLDSKNGWDQITYKDRTGYSSSNYLTDSKKEVEKAREKHIIEEESKNQEAVETMKFINNILLVNKTYGLPSNYNPGEDPEAVAHLKEMIKAAKEEEGMVIKSVSGFRSYDYQKGLYDRYVKRDGEKKASMYSAKPGYSEHQTGLAFDIGGTDKSKWVNDSFDGTKEAVWLAENAHRFGFILRYPKGKTNITGYKYEPWHFRYVGAEHAKKIYELGVTLEEYLL